MTLGVATAGLAAVLCHRQQQKLTALHTVAETVRKKMLRPLPNRIGGLRTEGRHQTAGIEGLVGGDVYDVIRTPFGVRLFIGDVMGKGPSAVGTAMDVLGSFRALAPHERGLPAMAQRMDAALADRDGSADFVTALLISVANGTECAEMVSCGHPPPLLIRAGRATFVDALPPSPPLGLFDLQDEWCQACAVPLTDHDRLLLYTDGVTEARDAKGSFYPLAERATILYDDDPGTFLDAVTADLLRHSMGELKDDAALLLIDFEDIRARARNARTEKQQSLQNGTAGPIR